MQKHRMPSARRAMLFERRLVRRLWSRTASAQILCGRRPLAFFLGGCATGAK